MSAPAISRRYWLATGMVASLAACRSLEAASEHAQTNGPIIQPEAPEPAVFINRAFEMKRLATHYGDQPYGAIIVKQNRIVGQSWSRVIIDQDPTAHAEIAAIRDAARRLNSRQLAGCVMYSSSRPCPMCEGAAYWAGINEMLYGEDGRSAGTPRLCRG